MKRHSTDAGLARLRADLPRRRRLVARRPLPRPSTCPHFGWIAAAVLIVLGLLGVVGSLRGDRAGGRREPPRAGARRRRRRRSSTAADVRDSAIAERVVRCDGAATSDGDSSRTGGDRRAGLSPRRAGPRRRGHMPVARDADRSRRGGDPDGTALESSVPHCVPDPRVAARPRPPSRPTSPATPAPSTAWSSAPGRTRRC